MQELYPDKVYQALPSSEAAQQEFQHLVIDHLKNDHTNKYKISNESIGHVHCNLSWFLDDESLWHTSLWIQEDVCLMELRGDEYCLTAASVCAPTNWPLEEKIGRSLDDIHKPVPGYGRYLSQRVNKLFASLKPYKPLLRYNWSVQNSTELFWRKDLTPVDTRQGGFQEYFWRVERQTLRRLPETGAIVFTIRVFIHRVSALDSTPDFSNNWQRMIDRLPADQKAYKGLMQFKEPGNIGWQA